MQSSTEAILAIDLGTSSVKAIVVGSDGTILGRGQASYPTLHPRDGFDEQLTEDWIQAIPGACSAARRFAPHAVIRGISVTGQMHGTVLLDEGGVPLHPAIIWSDRRASDMLAEIPEQVRVNLPAIIGGPIGTGYQALTLAWLGLNKPHLRDSVRRVMLPVDFVVHTLTGQFFTDASNAVSSGLLEAETGTWNAMLLNTFGVQEAWLPPVIPTGSHVGNLLPTMAEALALDPGIPVFHGGGDAPTAATGGDVLTHDKAMITLSTGAQVIRPVDTYLPEPSGRWHTWPTALPSDAVGSGWLHVGAIMNAGRAIDWIHQSLSPGISIADMMALAQSAPPGSGNLLFLPYLAGERSPLLDPYARGAFIGLSDAHRPQHLVRAVLEGIGLSLADTLDRMMPGSSRPSRIVFGGGGASPEVRQIIASVLGVALVVPPAQEISALGAARIGARSLGWISLGQQHSWDHGPEVIVRPVEADHEVYHERLAIFREATASLLPLMHRLQRRDA